MPESAKSMQHTFCKSIWLKSHHDVAAQLQITMERGRFQGTAAELCNALAPHAVHKSFVKYDESKDLMKAKVAADMKQIILAHAPILQSIHELQPNLSIPKKVCISALQLLVDQKSSQWEMETRHHADWVATMEVRLRNLLRVVSQGILKNRIWTSNLPWTTTPASPTIVSEAALEFFSVSTASSARPSGHRSVHQASRSPTSTSRSPGLHSLKTPWWLSGQMA